MFPCRYCKKTYLYKESRYFHEKQKHPEEVEARQLAKAQEKQQMQMNENNLLI
jgi:hypothetical protein